VNVDNGMTKDAQGRLVPLEMVKPQDQQRDELVRSLFAHHAAVRQTCDRFRVMADGDIDAHLKLIQEQYGVKRAGQVGNLVLSTYDGQYRIVRAVDKQITFTDEIHAAKQLIFECVKEWTKDTRKEIQVVVDDAFRQDKQGHLSADRILGLLRWDIEDDRWQRAMQAIKDSVQVQSTKTYLRFYERKADGAYQYVPAGV
jgi:hypothetical protein